MAIFECPQIMLMALCIFFLLYLILRRGKKSCEPTNWPLIGMLPATVQNVHRAHDKVTEVLCECGGTYWFRGPAFCNTDMLFTSDPANIQYIFNKNFSNYPKGPELRKKFDILGEGIFGADSELWELHRRTILSIMGNPKFYSSLERIVWHKVETGLLPVLDHFSQQATAVDLQEILQRFSLDNICQLVLGYDPCSLRTDLPYIPCEKAFGDSMQPLLYRHILPEKIWKLQKWLKIGGEKKLMEAWEAFDDFIYPHVSLEGDQEGDLNILAAYRKAYEESKIRFSRDLRDFSRDSLLGLLLAGRDTTSVCLTWLFWLIAQNPSAESKILEEIERELHVKKDGKWRFFNIQESSKLIYLHGALCESLRLFPPLALQYRSPVQSDTLPSGHYIEKNSKVIISFHTMGRMETVWGKDCLEFKPERWISARGGIKHEPSYKFPAFNVGPRSCPGKEMSFIQMKMVAATIIYHYSIQLVKGHPVTPRVSIILQATHGLMVTLSKRNV